MFTKTLLAALILASTAFAFTANAGPYAPTQGEVSWMDRASQLSDAGAI